MSLESLASLLYECGAIKFGSFTLKSGLQSPIYIDLRVSVSSPELLKLIGVLLWQKLADDGVVSQPPIDATTGQKRPAAGSFKAFDVLCGVPYTALPFAVAMALDHNVPMVVKRKEGRKEHGTGKLIEGVWSSGAKCLIVEDLVTSGGSVLETATALRAEGMEVCHAVCLLDREQGAWQALKADPVQPIYLHAVFTLTQLLEALRPRLQASQIDQALAFVRANQFGGGASQAGGAAATAAAAAAAGANSLPCAVSEPRSVIRSTYVARAKKAQNPVARRLLNLMDRKETNLCVSVDITDKSKLLSVIESVGESVCAVKIHCDIVDQFDDQFVDALKALAVQYDFVIFEDRKFADIGNTTKAQYVGGVHKIAEWADLTNCHMVSGPGIVSAVEQVNQALPGRPDRGLLLLAQMSSAGNMLIPPITKAAVKAARDNPVTVAGFICQQKLVDGSHAADDGLLHWTPGVRFDVRSDALDQQYRTPAQAFSAGTDILIVGRGITEASNPGVTAARYAKAGWEAYVSDLPRENP